MILLVSTCDRHCYAGTNLRFDDNFFRANWITGFGLLNAFGTSSGRYHQCMREILSKIILHIYIYTAINKIMK